MFYRSFVVKSWFYQVIGPFVCGGIVGLIVSPNSWRFWVAQMLVAILWCSIFHKKMS